MENLSLLLSQLETSIKTAKASDKAGIQKQIDAIKARITKRSESFNEFKAKNVANGSLFYSPKEEEQTINFAFLFDENDNLKTLDKNGKTYIVVFDTDNEKEIALPSINELRRFTASEFVAIWDTYAEGIFSLTFVTVAKGIENPVTKSIEAIDKQQRNTFAITSIVLQ